MTFPPTDAVDAQRIEQNRDDDLRAAALEHAVALAKHSGGLDAQVVDVAAKFYLFLKGETPE